MGENFTDTLQYVYSGICLKIECKLYTAEALHKLNNTDMVQNCVHVRLLEKYFVAVVSLSSDHFVTE